MSGIVRTYENRGSVRAYTGLPDAKHYAAKFRDGQSKPVMEMTLTEAQNEVMRRVACYIEERPAADAKAARQAILHDDEDLRRAAFPLPEERRRDEGQPARAYRHCQERAAHFVKSGRAKTLAEAHKLAAAESPALAGRAGVHPDLVVGADLLGQVSVRPPKLSDGEAKLKALTEQDVVNLMVTQPGRGELVHWLDFLRSWCRLTWPPVPVGRAVSGPGIPNDPHNKEQERIWQRVRQERLRTRGFTD